MVYHTFRVDVSSTKKNPQSVTRLREVCKRSKHTVVSRFEDYLSRLCVTQRRCISALSDEAIGSSEAVFLYFMRLEMSQRSRHLKLTTQRTSSESCFYRSSSRKYFIKSAR